MGELELLLGRVASGSQGIVMAYPDWLGTYHAWSQAIGQDGFPEGDRHSLFQPLSGPNGEGASGGIYHIPIASDGNRFVTAWFDTSLGVRMRETSGHGVPLESTVAIAPPDPCNTINDVAVAATDDVQAALYTTGCVQKDIYMRSRDRWGVLSAPIALVTGPDDEGAGCEDDILPLDAVAARDRIGIVYRTFKDWRDCFNRPQSFVFAEFDRSGVRIGELRDLLQDPGVDWISDVRITYDEFRDRYIVTFRGDGPQGWGVYYLPIAPLR